tara:strand:- start:3526 stop:4302 length:777 start_codon:yes stop_codon:yes gene_type:complete
MANAVTKPKKSEVGAFDAAMFEQDAGQGNQNISSDDLALPFLKLLSGLDSVLDTHATARKGDIYNTVSGEAISGKEGISVIPCAYQRVFIQWLPRGSGSGAPIKIYTPNDVRPKTERNSDDNKEYVVGGDGDYIEETHQHYVLVVKEDGSTETALIAMKSTQLKKSRKWNSMIQSVTMQGKNGPFTPPRFSHVYKIKSIAEENSKGSWHGWEMSRESVVQEASIYAQAKSFSESVLSGDVVVKHENEKAEGSSDDIPF